MARELLPPELAFYGLFAFAVGGMGLGAALYLHRARRWRGLGEALGLAPAGMVPRWAALADFRTLVGTRGDRHVQVRAYQTVMGGRVDLRWTAVEVALPAADPRFQLLLAHEGLRDRLAKRLGGADIDVGDAELDAAFRIRGSDEAAVRAALPVHLLHELRSLGLKGAILVEPGRRLAEGSLSTARNSLEEEPLDYRDPKAPKGSRRGAWQAGWVAQGPWMAVLRWVRPGLHADAEAVQRALPWLLRLADAVERAAPRA